VPCSQASQSPGSRLQHHDLALFLTGPVHQREHWVAVRRLRDLRVAAHKLASLQVYSFAVQARQCRRQPFPAARRWTGALWADERGIKAFDGPHDSSEAALDWAMERCPED